MKRKLICSLLAAVLLLGAAPAKAAAPVPVQVDGSLLPGKGQLEAGVTYVPLRDLLDAFGGWDVTWDRSARAAVGRSGDGSVTAGVGDDYITVDGTAHPLPGSVYLTGGRTYVPLRVAAEAMGAQVDWDPYLRGAAVTSPDFDLPCSAADFYWLSRIISAESQGEPAEGQVAVGNVVLNRVAAEEFPDSIPAVIFDRTDAVQFEPVANGTVYLEPTAQSVESAKRALAGERPVGESLYFFAPALSKGLWISANRTYLSTLGCHRFYL